MKLDRRDEISFGLTPVVPAPRFGQLEELAVGRVRYLVAKNGMFIEGRSRAMHGCLMISSWPGFMPFGEVKPFMRSAGGAIPPGLHREFVAAARRACPAELAGLVLWRNGAYELVIPENQDATAERVTYSTRGIDPLDVVIDMHSHGYDQAYFSGQDDRDDLACPSPCFNAMVFGDLRRAPAESVGRLVINGWSTSSLAVPAYHLSAEHPLERQGEAT